MTINYYIKSVYGNDTMYFAEDDNVTYAIQGLTGRKTITASDMKNLQDLGFSFVRVFEPTN